MKSRQLKNSDTILAFDADDTLWVNEPHYNKTQEKCKSIIQDFVDPDALDERLYATEIKNLRIFGYGAKGFTLSLIETAIELSEGKVPGSTIQKIIDLGKDLIDHPIQVLNGVEKTLKILKDDYELMIITKGDLFDQESKIVRSGLAHYFSMVEIVSEKNEDSYRKLLSRNNIPVDNILMIGNSLKSDVIPLINIGAKAIHIPYHSTWEHEKISVHQANSLSYDELSDISLLPSYLSSRQI